MHRFGWLCWGFLLLIAAQAGGDEGLWPLDRLPAQHLARVHNVALSDAFVQHIQASCVRFPRGGSGAFVSANGLIVTNHHVVAAAIAQLDYPAGRYLMDGFVAGTRSDELPCLDLYVDILEEIRDVTDQVEALAQVEGHTRPAKATAARNRALTDIAHHAAAETRLRAEPVILYRGVLRYVYLYRRHYDVRLVMAPEAEVAFWGGDGANYQFPRYCLDVCFLRVYRNGAPLACRDYFTWAQTGASAGDFIFVAGHPGQTHRLVTARHLQVIRDVEIPLKLGVLNQREVSLQRYVAQGPTQRRLGWSDLMTVQNTRKALEHRFNGLMDGDIIAARLLAERQLQESLEGQSELLADYKSGHRDVNLACGKVGGLLAPYYLLEKRPAPLGRLFDVARLLLRSATEREKNDLQRLSEYRNQNLEAMKMRLAWPGPVDAQLERVLIRATLMSMVRIGGGDYDLAKLALGDRSADAKADELIGDTQLHQLQIRNTLYSADATALADSDDAMIRFAGRLDGYSRNSRRAYEREVTGGLQGSYRRLVSLRMNAADKPFAPDGTGTLRLSFGKVAGYSENGHAIPAWTTLGDLFKRSDTGSNPCASGGLPLRWRQRSDRIDPDTPLNFVTSADITGGSSGSPAFDADGRLLGVVFDTNIQGLLWDYRYDDRQGRSICVDSGAVLEALRKIYDADALADELLGSGG